MKIWAVANQKGGVGKTTTVVGLGGLLAAAGKRVLLVDLDPHGSLTSYFKHNPDEMEKSVYQLFQHQGQVPESLPRQLILNTGYERLDFLPASTSLAMLERQAVSQGGAGLVISRTLAWLWNDYDYVLMDTPPILGVLLINAMAACQMMLLPVQTEFLAIKGLERMMRTLQMVMKSQKREFPYWVIPTMFDRRTQASVGSLRLLRQTYDGHIWPSAIMVDTRLRDASKAGVPPNLFDPGAGREGLRLSAKIPIDPRTSRGAEAACTVTRMNEDQHESPPANAMDQALMDYLEDILGAPDRGKPRPAVAKPQNVTPLEVVKPRPTPADVTPLPLKTESRQPAPRPFLQEEKPKTLSTLNLLNLRPPPEPPKPVLVPVEKPAPVEAKKKPAPPVAPPAEPVIAPAKPAAPPAPVVPDPVAVDASDEEDARLPAVAPARQPSAQPEWAQQRFECLIFNVAGLKLAVPLITLGAIHRIDRKLNALPHQSDWFIGILQTPAAGNIKVLDTALCVMPERYDPARRDNLAYVLTIHGYAWGLACHSVEKSITLEPHQVKWRSERGKRPWLAGTVIDHMCALIDTEGFGDVIRKAEQQT